MGLVIFFVIAWMILAVFFSLKQRLPSKVNIILFLMIQLVHINFYTIFSFKLEWFIVDKSPVAFITSVVYRDIILPSLLLLFINLVYSEKQAGNRFVITLSIWIILVATAHLLSVFGIERLQHWSIWYMGLFCAGMMVFSFLFKVLLMKLYLKENQSNDGPSI